MFQIDAKVLTNSGSAHSFLSTQFTNKLFVKSEPLNNFLFESILVGDKMVKVCVYKSCVIYIEGHELFAD